MAENPVDHDRFLQENEGKELVGYFEDRAYIGEKKRMLNYFHGPVLKACVKAWRELGEYEIDKVVAKYRLKAYFLKDYFINKEGEEEHFVKSLGRVTKDELKDFLDQVIHFMEEDLRAEVPDPDLYGLNTKRAFKDASKDNE